MFKRTKKKYTFGRFLADLATIPFVAVVGSTIWVADKITDNIN